MKRIATFAFAGFAVVALATTARAQAAKAELKDAAGKAVGTVTATETPHGVLLHASLMGLPPGTHAFHVHTTGTCEAPFTSAGGHFNPGAKQHGIANPQGMHAGDLPNFEVGADGKATFDAFATGVTMGAGADGLFKTGGTAIVVHAAADDYKGDPAGNAGARIACGVVTK